LTTTIKEQTDAIDTLTAEITDLTTQRKRAGEDRKAERAEYEGVIADQKETQSLLNQALSVLKDVYKSPTDAASLLQKSKAGQAPPPGFSSYEKQGAATGIVMMIEQIIADAKAMEAEATHAEQNAQDAYTKFVQTTNESIKAKSDAKTDLEGARASSKQEKTEAKSELDGTIGELEGLSNTKGALHKECDFTLKNFDVRQEARDQEIDALRKAKAFLSGMKAE